MKLKWEPLDEPHVETETGDPAGWNLIGLLDHKGGIGNAARMNVRALQQLLPNTRPIAFPSARLRPERAADVPAIHGHNYLHLNPCSLPIATLNGCPWFLQGENIGFWAWETTEAPKAWLKYDDVLRQIWVPSHFVKDALLATGFSTPIWVIPHSIEPQAQHIFPTEKEPLTFMVQFDGHSRMERKRPDLSLRAIQSAAIRSGEKVKIVIKTHRNEEIAFAEYPHIEVETITEWLDERRMQALWNRVDILVSLNRGEGFGLPMMEGMARGIPVVATHWGATTEYMTALNSYPVRALRVEDCAASGDLYFKTGQWALPDVEHATEQIMLAMRAIRENRMGQMSRAARWTASEHNFTKMTRLMKTAISTL